MKRGNPRRGAVLMARFGHRAAPPRPVGLQPDQQRDLVMCNLQNVDAIATGKAEPSMLWDYVGGVLTFWHMAQLLGVGLPEMDQQAELATRLVERFKQHGVVRFTGPDLEAARDGVVVMEQLAALVDMPIAVLAANLSEREVSGMTKAARQLAAQEQAAQQPQSLEAAT